MSLTNSASLEFIDTDSHYFPYDCYRNLPEPFKSLAPQFHWKSYSEKPKFWDITYGVPTARDSAEFTKKTYDWENFKNRRFVWDDNGFHDIDIFPGGVARYLDSVRVGLEKKLPFSKDYGGPHRGSLRYSEPGAIDLEARKSAIAALGVHKNVLVPYNYMMGLTYRINYELAVAMAGAYNSTVQQDCQDQDQFWPLIWIPAQNPNVNENLEMIEQGIDRGAVGVMLGEHFTSVSHCLGQAWGTCSWMEPVWAHADQHQYPIFFHINDCWYDNLKYLKTTDSVIVSKWLQTHKNLLPLIQQSDDPLQGIYELSFASLITEGVLDRYPNLRLVWQEKGIHWVLPLLTKLSTLLNKDCTQYLKNWSFGAHPEWTNFDKDAQAVGYDRLIFCTDYPHFDIAGMNQLHDVKMISELNTDPINRQKIANLNVRKLFDKTNFK